MSIYDRGGAGRGLLGSAGRQIALILLVVALAVGALFVVSGAVPWFNPGVEYSNEGAPGGDAPDQPAP